MKALKGKTEKMMKPGAKWKDRRSRIWAEDYFILK